MSLVEKLCPVVLREFSGERQLLVFEHQLAGVQLVKGTREPGEAVGDGALRELREESGISTASFSGSAWTSLAIAEGQLWHFVPVEAGPLPDRFAFDALDDGGHSFRFFGGPWTHRQTRAGMRYSWRPLEKSASGQCSQSGMQSNEAAPCSLRPCPAIRAFQRPMDHGNKPGVGDEERTGPWSECPLWMKIGPPIGGP